MVNVKVCHIERRGRSTVQVEGRRSSTTGTETEGREVCSDFSASEWLATEFMGKVANTGVKKQAGARFWRTLRTYKKWGAI